MTAESHPYANTRAARLLAQGLKEYTAKHSGGLRALASNLEIKQATVLSHMANGRIGIPLERAAELASRLGMDTAHFCMAVLEQRAPSVYEVIDDELKSREGSDLSGKLRELLNRAASRDQLTDEHIEIIGEALATKQPTTKWIRPWEEGIIRAVRERFPDLSYSQSQELIDWIGAFPDE